MPGEFYKMDYEAWDEGTDELSLEQEAAYLRLCHQLYRRKASIPSAPATLARIWRCHPNKARKLLADLVEARKIIERDGRLTNTRVTRELDARETRRTQQADAGHIGGTQTQDNRRNALSSNGADAAVASTPVEANSSRVRERGRVRDQIEAPPPSDPRADSAFPPRAFDEFWAAYPHKVGKDAARKAFDIVRRSGRVAFAALMDGLDRYKASKPPTRDWCHPTTWLNQGRWADEPADLPSGGRDPPTGPRLSGPTQSALEKAHRQQGARHAPTVHMESRPFPSRHREPAADRGGGSSPDEPMEGGAPGGGVAPLLDFPRRRAV